MTSRWTRIGMAAAVTIAGLTPGHVVSAQSPPAPASSAVPEKAPAPLERLDEAKRLLDGIGALKPKGEAAKQLAAIRQNFEELVSAYRQSLAEDATSKPTLSIEESLRKTGPVDWREKFSDIERDLTYLIGGGPATEPSATAVVGTTGVSSEQRPTDASDVTDTTGLADASQRQLKDFRRALELFYVGAVITS